MKIVLMTFAILMSLASQSFASGAPDVMMVYSGTSRVWFCLDSDVSTDCRIAINAEDATKEDTLLEAKRSCIYNYGSLDKCIIQEETYDAIRYPSYFSQEYQRQSRKVIGSIIISRKK